MIFPSKRRSTKFNFSLACKGPEEKKFTSVIIIIGIITAVMMMITCPRRRGGEVDWGEGGVRGETREGEDQQSHHLNMVMMMMMI